jgi:hypothetical protein
MVRETLSLPTAAQREALLRLWAAILPSGSGPFPAPFGERRVREWCEAPGMTPRMLLIAATRALEGEEPDTIEPQPNDGEQPELRVAAILHAYNEQVQRAREAIDQASAQDRCVEAEPLAEAFGVALRFVQGAKVVSTQHARPAQMVIERAGKQTHMALLTRAHPRGIASTLEALLKLSDQQRVVVVRERTHDFPPTWKVCSERKRLLQLSDRCSWIVLEREDAARMLALRSLFANARSRDVVDHDGRPLDEQDVHAWVREQLRPGTWQPIEALFAEPGMADKQNDEPVGAPPPEPSQSVATGAAVAALARLRVASVDRVVREAQRTHPQQTRASLIAELRAPQSGVRWFGNTVVSMREGAR